MPGTLSIRARHRGDQEVHQDISELTSFRSHQAVASICCSAVEGWQEVPTNRDSFSFGVWVHPARREFALFADGVFIQSNASSIAALWLELTATCTRFDAAPMYAALHPITGDVICDFSSLRVRSTPQRDSVPDKPCA